MREILFRGKRCDNGEWVQGFYVRADYHWHNNGIHKDWIICGAAANGGWFALHSKYAVVPDTVGQFTGLTDRNGKRIFEGDIVSVKIGGLKRKGVVFYEDTATRFGLAIGTEKNFSFLGRQMAKTYEAEVIGNINDNPELLEVGE